MSENGKNVTTLEELKEMAEGEVVTLPGFLSAEKPFNVRLKRPSMMELVSEEEIPNPLLPKLNELFFHGQSAEDAEKKDDVLGETFPVMDVIAQKAMVSPTYQEVKEAGLNLTDEQLTAIFNFVLKGVTLLSSFRTK